MVGIEAVGSYIPPARINNIARVKEFDTDKAFILNKIGFETLARKSDEDETSDLCVKAYEDLQIKIDIPPNEVDCLVVCSQNPDGFGLPQTSAVVHHKLQLDNNVAAFDVSLGCSGYVYGLSILQSFMIVNGFKKGLLFTADPYSKILNHADKNTELLFGDAAACTLLTANPKYILLKSVFSTDGSGSGAIIRGGMDGTLTMNGQDIFMFAMKNVPQQVTRCLRRNGLSKEEVDLFIFHQGSKYIIDNLRKRMQLPKEKVPFFAQDIGNTVSSTIPLGLQEVFGKAYENIVISGFGVGLSWATTILQKNNISN